MTLPPCHICGAPSRVEVFGPNEAIQGALTMWGCSASTAFGGTCSNIVGSLTEDNWRELNPSPPAADADLVERLRRRGNRQDHGLMMHGEFLNPDGPAAAARIEALSRPVEVSEEMVDKALIAFNGGMINLPDATNSRGYTTFYAPRKAMLKAMLAARDVE